MIFNSLFFLYWWKNFRHRSARSSFSPLNKSVTKKSTNFHFSISVELYEIEKFYFFFAPSNIKSEEIEALNSWTTSNQRGKNSNSEIKTMAILIPSVAPQMFSCFSFIKKFRHLTGNSNQNWWIMKNFYYILLCYIFFKIWKSTRMKCNIQGVP